MGSQNPEIITCRERPRVFQSIQILRAVAALLVALFHGHQALVSNGAREIFDGESYFFSFGAVGVHIFFVISGFIMVHATRFGDDYKISRFLRRRLIRIFPIYWLCAGFYLSYHFFSGTAYDLTFLDGLQALFLLPGHASKIIGPAWTLSFEMYFYVCFGLAMMLGLNRGIVVLSVFFIASITLQVIFDIDASSFALAFDPLLLEFLAGCAIGWLHKYNLLPESGGRASIVSAVLLFGIGAIVGFDAVPSVIMWGLPSAFLVLGLVISESRKKTSTELKSFGRLGDSSYALYLIHILVITIALDMVQKLGFIDRVSPIAMTVLIAVIAQIIAEFLHRRIEKPLLRRFNPPRRTSKLADGPDPNTSEPKL